MPVCLGCGSTYRDKLFVKVQLCGAEPEHTGCVYKLEQATEVEHELVEEFKVEC